MNGCNHFLSKESLALELGNNKVLGDCLCLVLGMTRANNKGSEWLINDHIGHHHINQSVDFRDLIQHVDLGYTPLARKTFIAIYQWLTL